MHSRPTSLVKFFFAVALILSLATFASAQGPSAEASVATADASTSAPVPPPATTDDGWHVGVTPYLWFAGIHGTVGALGRQTSVHASVGDIFSNFNIGFMGTLEARKNRFITTADIMWMRLSDDKGLPINEAGITSVEGKVRQFIVTPMIGYRIVDNPKIKVDASVGFRFWHLGEGLEFTPNLIGGVNVTQNWADALGGARFQFPLGEKAQITIMGDAGGGGASSDYQVVGLLGYKLGKKCILQGGWRYLDADFRGSNGFIFDAATSGVLVGVTINLK